ncbi:group II intron reverse transcriptase/maturase [Proteiniphilum sp. UBA5384]|uniref:group II intron reverse transcriptase/maturase n=1 Tax=Proteiniphilum sp. UBA5384 TaxID=1947279 RepID=UPI0025E790F9|nr:group II intron reverse transcriptase/maturase [Proteiniphilum sp. UBA5384]
MHKTRVITSTLDCPQKNRTESEGYEGVQTYMDMKDGSLIAMQPSKEDLMSQILSPVNLNRAYLQVVRNKGVGGVDMMDCKQLLPYLHQHKEELIESIRIGKYKPNPVRRVEIPKDNGKKRLLGIPTVVDRLIQQAIAQVLSPIYERQFSQGSFGFRPKRSAHGALLQVCRYASEGYKYAVGIDLARFFDTVNHSFLLRILSRTIKDGHVISLIHKYLTSGVMIGKHYEPSMEGTPQGGPLSPLLSNIMLNELDKELERRGHRFVRYADDSMILCKSKRSAERVCASITEFVEKELHLTVNREKTEVGYIRGMKYLGHSFYFTKGKCRLCVHKKTKDKFKRKVKSLTGRSNGMGYAQRKEVLWQTFRGWLEYFKYADMKTMLKSLDQWYRRRLRMCIWKCWKKVKTRYANLQKCGIPRGKAWEWANTRKGYWHISDSYILARALRNELLMQAGYPLLEPLYETMHIDCETAVCGTACTVV